MQIFSPEQLSKLDQLTIDEKQISSHQLMQIAAEKACDALLERLDINQKIYFFCGVGNNAGDGFAMAKILFDQGFKVEVFILKYADKLSRDAQLNYTLLQEVASIQEITAVKNLPEFDENAICIDAIFGVGLNRELPGFVQEIIQHLNQSRLYSLAIDCPSGLYVHQANNEKDIVFKADLTLTFHAPKLSFLLSDFGNYVGEMQILDIGLLQTNTLESSQAYIDLKYIKSILKRRSQFSHKGTYGHAVIVGGQEGMFGSVMLSAQAAMRSGVGKLTVLCPPKAVAMINTVLPEAMTKISRETKTIDFQRLDFSYQALGIGMGIGDSKQALEALKRWLSHEKQPVLLDADALNLLSEHPDLLRLLPVQSILTPHIGELQRLLGKWTNAYDMLDKAKLFSKKYDCILVLKEAYTKIVYHDNIYINSTGNPGMATAGSGDVLAGLMTGMLAQNYTSLQASVLGVFLHGLAGDLYVKKASQNSLIASDLIDNLALSFSFVER
ncbi:MAG: NAD(P)H-hydrate dehydratase [Psychroflexus sp.]|nr:NAD(P)H-hydrate dehydratase [Psychroflexus sp.]MDN6309445.1 NAD(P)H-hydrate dehydratase [Psychroflexus sp.]